MWHRTVAGARGVQAETGMGSGCVLKEAPIGLPDGLDGGDKRTRILMLSFLPQEPEAGQVEAN